MLGRGRQRQQCHLDITAQVRPSMGSVGSALNDLGLAGKDAQCIGESQITIEHILERAS